MRSRTVFFIGAVVLLVLAVLVGRMALGAWTETRRAAEAAKSGQRKIEARHLRRAMAFYFPGNPWVGGAKDRLVEIAEQSEDLDFALYVWHELRSAILALRTVGQPFSSELTQANARIASLSSRRADVANHLQGKRGRSVFLKMLEEPPSPNPMWVIIGLLGFVIWVGATIGMIYRGLDNDGRRTSGFSQRALIAVAGVVLFFVGMALA